MWLGAMFFTFIKIVCTAGPLPEDAWAFMVPIYDSLRLRGAVAHHARILAMLAAKHPDVATGPINMRLGHTVPEIVAGIITGGVLAAITWWALHQV